MDSTLSLKKGDGQRDAKFVPPPEKPLENLANTEELLAKLAQEAATLTNRSSGAAQASFSAGPRVAAPAPGSVAPQASFSAEPRVAASPSGGAAPQASFSAGPRVAAPSPDIAPRPLGAEQAAGGPRSRGRRTMPGPLRFLLAAGIGVAATLAWQSYGAAGRRMVATYVPQLGLSSSPDMTQGLPGTVNEDTDAAVDAKAASAVPPPAAGSDPLTPAPAAASDPVVAPAPASAEVMQQLEAMAHDIAAMRQSMEALGAAQSQMARTIAALQAEDARREPATPAPHPARKPPSPPRAALAPGPRPLSQSLPASPAPSPPPLSQSLPASPSPAAPVPAGPAPLRPPGSMP